MIFLVRDNNGGAFLIPSGYGASQDALDGAAVELFEDPRAHVKSFQPPEGEEGSSSRLWGTF